MTGTISRLVDNRQVGSVAAEDGREYLFPASALRGVEFSRLSLGTAVIFTPAQTKPPRAEFVQLAR